MSHTPHELHEEFPALAERIHALKVSDAHFARLADEYHAVNREVHRAETGVTPVDSLAESALRKKRSHLKDEIARILAKA
ncbi:MAG: YdcH family protein [Albidovulum sp.]